MASEDNQPPSYPSPEPSAQSHLPFYQSSQQHRDHSQNNEQSAADGVDSSSQAVDSESPAYHGVPDDPQLRANLASMMGNFGNFTALHPSLGNQASTASSAQFHSESGPFQAGEPADVAADSPDRNRDKRSKVSRACDECRRKKIRCDATEETGDVPCTNCTRTGARCAFRRQPLKRGPSKGYIKQLADRLNYLEQQVHPPHLQQQHLYEIQQVQRAMAEGMRGYSLDADHVPNPRVGDKRSYQVAQAPPSGQMRQLQYSNETVNAAPGPPLLHGRYPDDAIEGFTPFWQQSHSTHFEPVGLPYGPESPSAAVSFDWDEDVIEEYYRIIHQTFPLLPNTKHRLRQRLGECPASLREAFVVALDCCMRTFPTTTLSPNPGYPQALQRAAELLAKYPFDNPSSHTKATSLVYLQTLLLMALESDNHGPATMRGQAGPSRAELLGRAAGVAGQLEMNMVRPTSHSVMQDDRDSDDRLARRVWWVLFILDRWHASSTADLLKLPENSVVLLPEDQTLLGESTYHLARLSFIIGHLAAIVTTTKLPTTDIMAPTNPAAPLLSMTLAGEIDRFRESVESVWGAMNLLHLSYHHCHLLIKRLNPATEPTDLLPHAVKVATILNSRRTPLTPLNHHFGALAAMTLCELCDVPKTHADAARGLDQMAECLGANRGLAGRQQSEGWDGAVRELVLRKKDQLQHPADGGLRDLAAAAIGGAAAAPAAPDPSAFDPTQVTRHGYLTCLALGRFTS